MTAAVLAEAGLEVVVLEAGPYMDHRSYPEEPLAALSALYRDGGLTIAEGRPAIPTPVGRARRRDHGDQLRHLLPGPRARCSPVACRARDRVGHASSTPTTPRPRRCSTCAPVDPERMGRNGQLLLEGAEALGVSHEPLRRNAGRCDQCSSCPTGCRLDAKRAMHVSYLPRAVAAGARIRADVEAQRIIFERGRAAGVDCVSSAREGPASPFRFAPGERWCSPGGAFGTPELLLRSGFASPSGAARAQPADPPRLLGRRAFRRAGPRLGRRDAELRGDRVGGPRPPAGGDLHAARVRRASGCRAPGPSTSERVLAYDRIASTGVHLSDTLVRPRRPGPRRVAAGRPTA